MEADLGDGPRSDHTTAPVPWDLQMDPCRAGENRQPGLDARGHACELRPKHEGKRCLTGSTREDEAPPVRPVYISTSQRVKECPARYPTALQVCPATYAARLPQCPHRIHGIRFATGDPSPPWKQASPVDGEDHTTPGDWPTTAAKPTVPNILDATRRDSRPECTHRAACPNGNVRNCQGAGRRGEGARQRRDGAWGTTRAAPAPRAYSP